MSLLLAKIFWTWLLPAAIQASPVLLAAACLDFLMPRLVSPRPRTSLWLAAAAKLLLPFPTGGGMLPEPAAAFDPTPLPAWGLPAVWAAGVVILFAGGVWWIRSTIADWNAVSRPAPAIQERVVTLAKSLGLKKPPHVVTTRAIPGPLVFGRTLYWPAGLESALSAAEVDQALRHELTHLHRRDGMREAAWTLLLVVFWFHPMVWWAAHRMRALREQCCDQTAAGLPGHDAESYRTALLRVLQRVLAGESRQWQPGLSLVDPRAPMSHRLALLSEPASGKVRNAASLVCMLAMFSIWPACGWAERRAAQTAEWIERPPGSLQLRYLVLERLADARPEPQNH